MEKVINKKKDVNGEEERGFADFFVEEEERRRKRCEWRDIRVGKKKEEEIELTLVCERQKKRQAPRALRKKTVMHSSKTDGTNCPQRLYKPFFLQL